ncbi:MAG: TRAP transporter small permease [Deltaproteobacteria bacterium]|nr:TRAP transporter small permease [Deltaproteobacteria bacterium]
MKDLVLGAIEIATKVTKWLVFIAAVAIGVMAIINFTDVVLAKFFKHSIPGALDITEEVMVLVALFPISYLALERGHINIAMLRNIMGPALRFIVEVFQYTLAALICGFITVRVFAQFQKTLAFMTLKEGIDLPIWPANLATAIAFAFLTIVWVLLLAKTLVAGVKK